jgi:hypothetical protein
VTQALTSTPVCLCSPALSPFLHKCDTSSLFPLLQGFTVLSTGSLLAVSYTTSLTQGYTPVDSWAGSAMPTAQQTQTAQLPSQ